MSVKICIIGAGSATFSLSLVRDLCLTPNLKDSTVSLVDINEERLNGVYGLCKRFADEVGAVLKLEKTTDRCEALKGADFVINTALASGGHDRLMEGWSIAMKHGYRFGGSYHIVHDEAFWINFYQLRLMEEIYLDIQRICPDAWYILVANPVLAGITYLKRKYKDGKIVGLCHGSNEVVWIAKQMGLDPDKITYEVPGVNHFIWLTKFYYNGEDAFPLLEKWIEERSGKYAEETGNDPKYASKPFDLYRIFGVYPIGDTANPGGGAWPYWYHATDEMQKKWNEDPYEWYVKEFNRVDSRAEEINRLAEDESRKVTEVFPAEKSGEPMIPLIESLACDVERVLIVNILNDGNFVPGVPLDFQVEVPALISRKGIQEIKTDGLPRELIAFILRDRVAPVEVELAAFEKRSREGLINLIMMDPWTRSREQAEALLEDILALPYNKEMKEYYK